jgi:5-methylcytosine-specific restriction endonuclease McrA
MVGDPLAVLRRDGYRCTSCGSTEDLEVHHVDPDGGDRLSNLVTHCRRCHPR